MKRFMSRGALIFIVGLCATYSCAMHNHVLPGSGQLSPTTYEDMKSSMQQDLLQVSLSSQREQRARLDEIRADARDHSIDVVIASLFLVGSGIPGVSDEVMLVANVAASVLWLGDSSVRLVYALKKWRTFHHEPIPELQSIVIN